MSKLNLVRPKQIELELGKKVYKLVYDFNAFAELEDNFGSVQEAFEKMTQAPKMKDILIIVKAGLASNDEEITTKELGKYLTPATLPKVMELVNEAISLAMPEAEEGNETAKN